MLLISDDLTVVEQICDRLLVMKDGRIVEEGPTKVVFEATRRPYTKVLLEAVPRLL